MCTFTAKVRRMLLYLCVFKPFFLPKAVQEHTRIRQFPEREKRGSYFCMHAPPAFPQKRCPRLPLLPNYVLFLPSLLPRKHPTQIAHWQRTRNPHRLARCQNRQIPSTQQAQEAKAPSNLQQLLDVRKVRGRFGARDAEVGGGDEGEEHHEPEKGGSEEGVDAQGADQEDEGGEDPGG
jgi:hypothetical protein